MENSKDNELWKKCVDFHGHSCGGLAIGYRAALYAKELLGTGRSEDEEIVCVAENDACGVDAIQVLLGCSAGKGNLLFRMRGKQAFSFFRRSDGKAVRLVAKEVPEMSKEERFAYRMKSDAEDLFTVSEPGFSLPERARIFRSVRCEQCGEVAAEPMIRLQDGKKLCLDCFQAYDRVEEV